MKVRVLVSTVAAKFDTVQGWKWLFRTVKRSSSAEKPGE
jgi:hypothetical protein